MLFIFSIPVLVRHLWQLKTTVFIKWRLIRSALLSTYGALMNWTKCIRHMCCKIFNPYLYFKVGKFDPSKCLAVSFPAFETFWIKAKSLKKIFYFFSTTFPFFEVSSDSNKCYIVARILFILILTLSFSGWLNKWSKIIFEYYNSFEIKLP
jgi:hypothetical protein